MNNLTFHYLNPFGSPAFNPFHVFNCPSLLPLPFVPAVPLITFSLPLQGLSGLTKVFSFHYIQLVSLHFLRSKQLLTGGQHFKLALSNLAYECVYILQGIPFTSSVCNSVCLFLLLRDIACDITANIYLSWEFGAAPIHFFSYLFFRAGCPSSLSHFPS